MKEWGKETHKYKIIEIYEQIQINNPNNKHSQIYTCIMTQAHKTMQQQTPKQQHTNIYKYSISI